MDDLLSNKYYRITAEIREVNPAVWMARSKVVRTDTGEIVKGGKTVHDDSHEKVAAKLYEHAKQVLERLDPPYDWGNPDRVRLLIQSYIVNNRVMTDAYMSLEESRSKGTLTKSELHRAYHFLRDTVTNGTIDIARKLGQFSEEEKIKLMASSEEVYGDILDPWNLDDVYARDALFKYVGDPSDEVVKAHELHHRRMQEEFKDSN